MFLVGVIFGAIAISCLGCNNSPPQPVAPSLPNETPEPESPFGRIDGFTYTRTVEGIKEFDITAKTAAYFEQGQRAEFTMAHIIFFAKDGQRLEMTAQSGVFWTDSKNIEASGSVEIRSSRGYRAMTDKLLYDADKKEIHTDSKVTVVSNEMSLEGIGMRLSVTDQTLELKKSVKATAMRN